MSAANILQPTVFNVGVATASGALGALESWNRSKDVARSDMIQRQIDDLKGRENGGDFNVLDKMRLIKAEVDQKMQKVREDYPTLTAALNAMANAAVGYASASAVQRTIGGKPTIPGKVKPGPSTKIGSAPSISSVDGALQAIREVPTPHPVIQYGPTLAAMLYGGIRGWNEGKDQGIPNQVGRTAAGALGSTVGMGVGGLAGGLAGGLIGGSISLPISMLINRPGIAPLGAGIGALGGGVYGSFRGAKGGANVAKNVMDSATGKTASVEFVPHENPLLKYGPTLAALLYGGVRGYNEGEGQGVPNQIGRSAAGALGSTVGMGVGGTVGGLGGGVMGGLGGGLLGVPFSLLTKRPELMLAGASVGAGLGSLVGAGYGGVRGAKGGADIAQSVMDSATGKSKEAAAELFHSVMEDYAQQSGRRPSELTLEEREALVGEFEDKVASNLVPILGAIYGGQRGVRDGLEHGGGIGEIVSRGGTGALGGGLGATVGGILGGVAGYHTGGPVLALPSTIGSAVLGAKGGSNIAKWLNDLAFEPDPAVTVEGAVEAAEANPAKTASAEDPPFDYYQDAFRTESPVEDRAAQLIEMYKRNAETTPPQTPAVVGSLVGGGLAGSLGALVGSMGRASRPGLIGAAVGLPTAALLYGGARMMQNRNMAAAAEKAKMNPEDLVPYLRTIDENTKNPHNLETADPAYSAIDYLTKGAESLSDEDAFAFLGAMFGVEKLAFAANNEQAAELGTTPQSQSHASTGPLPPQPAEPGIFDKIQPYIKPALLLGGGALLGTIGTKGMQRFRMGGEKMQHLMAQGWGVPKEKAIKFMVSPEVTDDIRAGIRHLGKNLDVHQMANMTPEMIRQHGASAEAAQQYLGSLAPKLAEVDYEAMAPENLSMEQAIRPYTGGLAGMGIGTLAGRMAGGSGSVAKPVLGALLGYGAGSFVGRHSLTPEEQLALREFEEKLPAIQAAQQQSAQQIAKEASAAMEEDGGGVLDTIYKYRWPLVAGGSLVGGGLLGAGLYNRARNAASVGAEAVEQLSPIQARLQEIAARSGHAIPEAAAHSSDAGPAVSILGRVHDAALGGVDALKQRLLQLREAS